MEQEQGTEERPTAYEQLSEKQQLFVEEYLQCWNATKAARRADYAHPNKQGPRLLVNVGIQAAIQQRLKEAAMQADEVLARLAQQARGDIAEVFRVREEEGKDGSVRKRVELALVELIEEGQSHLVKSITWTRNGPKVEMYDAQAALQLIGRHHKLFTDKIDLTSGDEPITNITVNVRAGDSAGERCPSDG